MVALTRAVILGGRAIRKTQGRAFYRKRPAPGDEATNHVAQHLKGAVLFKVRSDRSIKALFTLQHVAFLSHFSLRPLDLLLWRRLNVQ